MADSPRMALILPAYNEVKRIAQTIREAKAYFEVRQWTHEIIVSTDGDDGTRELAAEMARSDQALRVIGSVERRGKGYGWAALDLFGRQRIDGYMFDVEILYLAQRAGYHIAQVPVRWRNDGDSRLALLSGNVRNEIDLFMIRFAKSRKQGQLSGAGHPGTSQGGKREGK